MSDDKEREFLVIDGNHQFSAMTLVHEENRSYSQQVDCHVYSQLATLESTELGYKQNKKSEDTKKNDCPRGRHCHKKNPGREWWNGCGVQQQGCFCVIKYSDRDWGAIAPWQGIYTWTSANKVYVDLWLVGLIFSITGIHMKMLWFYFLSVEIFGAIVLGTWGHIWTSLLELYC